MGKVSKAGFPALVLLLAACMPPERRIAADATILDEPENRAWLKAGSTVEDEDRAREECGEELWRDETLRDQLHAVRFAEFVQCMKRKGFRLYRDL